MKRLAVCLLAIALTTCLHFISHLPLISAPELNKPLPPPNHNIANIDNPQYLQFMHEINKITNQAGFVQRTLSLMFQQKYPQLVNLFKDINVGLEAIKKSLIKNKLLITEKQKICPLPHSFNQTEIVRYMSYTTLKQKSALAIISKHDELKGIQNDALKMINLTNKYIELVTKTMAREFCKQLVAAPKPILTAPTIFYKNNLKVNNWYYGSSSKSNYNAYLSKRAKILTLTSCPVDKPFVRDDEQKCFNCEPHSIYNLGAQKCESCKPGEMLNIGKGSCEPCYGEQFIVNHRFICKPCAIESQELYNPTTRKCYKCDKQSYLEQSKRECIPINCPADKPMFNKELEQCQACPAGTRIDPKDLTKCVKNNLVGKCPQNKPFYNQRMNQCWECPQKTVYNQASKVCEKKRVQSNAKINILPSTDNNVVNSMTNGAKRYVEPQSNETLDPNDKKNGNTAGADKNHFAQSFLFGQLAITQPTKPLTAPITPVQFPQRSIYPK